MTDFAMSKELENGNQLVCGYVILDEEAILESSYEL